MIKWPLPQGGCSTNYKLIKKGGLKRGISGKRNVNCVRKVKPRIWMRRGRKYEEGEMMEAFLIMALWQEKILYRLCNTSTLRKLYLTLVWDCYHLSCKEILNFAVRVLERTLQPDQRSCIARCNTVARRCDYLLYVCYMHAAGTRDTQPDMVHSWLLMSSSFALAVQSQASEPVLQEIWSLWNTIAAIIFPRKFYRRA